MSIRVAQGRSPAGPVIGVGVVDEFTIPNYEFPKEFNDAILATQVANQQNLQAKQLQEKARTEAETALIVAQGLANAQKAQATTLTPEYLQLQAINKWNGQLPQYLTPNTPLPFIGTTPTPTTKYGGRSQDRDS